ncbi:arsenate reductase (thioredoxin) [Lactiplantibacillus sp. WILCCON 0030]|uniref:Arsenate reductase (Thioredoxin) n=1 Tax=Lactiplantibacillus brownii TaxID=3069269 RepID=A0ABU1ABB9_9LACO|nr:arsenate reductase (thioredoxin) [Lactiplantibacillus brownii]MDQ7938288.1 arsenate reductase (thioredoxin) [Lactiplantibacillus brownii]
MPKQLYFLCTGNACRSQMAEGFAKKLLPADWTIQSAGVEVHGLDPRAVQVMAELGIDIASQQSKKIDPVYLRESDLVITLCGDARDRCPVTPPSVQKLHWPLPDPAQAPGTPAEQLVVFRQVRDEIKTRIQSLNDY